MRTPLIVPLYNALTSRRANLICVPFVVALVVVGVVAGVSFHDLFMIVMSAGIALITAGALWQMYAHRGDPDWPPRIGLVRDANNKCIYEEPWPHKLERELFLYFCDHFSYVDDTTSYDMAGDAIKFIRTYTEDTR